LKDNVLADLAADIIENIEAGLANFRSIVAALGKVDQPAPSKK